MLSMILDIAGIIFLGLATFNVAVGRINTLAAGILCFALAATLPSLIH